MAMSQVFTGVAKSVLCISMATANDSVAITCRWTANSPLQHWKKGDVIIDEQELKVPADFPPGEYAMMIGLYSGNNRLKVKDKEQA